jgi:hypothetical protein
MGFRDIFPDCRPLIGMVHLAPLPGAPRYGGDLEEVERRALADAEVLVGLGYDGLLVENYGDAPFHPDRVGPETVAAMTLLTSRIVREYGIPVGVNVLRNDAAAALAIAVATAARFLRVNVHTGTTVTDQGLIHGRADRTLRERARLGADVMIFADVLVKHGVPLGPPNPALIARDCVERGLADALLVTGLATGAAVDPERVEAVRAAVPGTPILVASGLNPESALSLGRLADGAIAGTWMKRDGVTTAPVDPARARTLLAAWQEAA